MRSIRAVLFLLAMAVAGCSHAPTPRPFDGWAWVVVAGDNQAAHEDTPTQAFDNARRDVVAAFEARGFDSKRMAQFSVEPAKHDGAPLLTSAPDAIVRTLGDLASTSKAGCLVYITSHGSPDGVVVGKDVVPPAFLARAVSRACGARPTAVIISACFSGVFIPALRGPDRFVLTAARRDRSSFGCGESDRYPFFDGCVIETLPLSSDFIDLAARTRACVAKREDEEDMRPRSQPQLSVGPAFRQLAPAFGGGVGGR